MTYSKRLKSDHDPEPFLEEISGVAHAWDTSTGRQDKIPDQREAKGISRRGLRNSAIGGRKRYDVHESRWTTVSQNCPAARAFLKHVAQRQDGILGRAKIVCLPAGKRVCPHIDRGRYYRVRNRYHLLLTAAHGSRMKAGDEEVRMRQGELWWCDNDQMYGANDDGDQNRIHMLFDMQTGHPAEEVPGAAA
ncbi:aspartyl/asparaginyl beta-hydroxylase domain-containing protein [Roseobacter sp. YSTF-M11]|uniref:Aspartyl/asparaginyl beta-hydroxylase domain-containing protein n=1 Tax=Roseobacter insulae TaxID=2859783 RepID=A0A9X1FWS6_9RHOB|nr:aspartyl/asparaginyl beta-hydroxylase domain-containing protein [Roseobacter insulae]MBW4709209.1 aspartyl/asparaginyl beta-hydroxylase domain-containing protein [Roseobacter insulae]